MDEVLTKDDAVMRAEVKQSVDNSKKSSFYNKMSEYMF